MDATETNRSGAALGRARRMPLEVALALRILDSDETELAVIEAKLGRTDHKARDRG